MPNSVLGADPIKQHLRGGTTRPEPPSEDLAVIREYLLGQAVAGQGRQQALTHRARGGPPHPSPSHPGRAVPRATTVAHTTNRELSSIPVMTFTSTPSRR